MWHCDKLTMRCHDKSASTSPYSSKSRNKFLSQPVKEVLKTLSGRRLGIWLQETACFNSTGWEIGADHVKIAALASPGWFFLAYFARIKLSFCKDMHGHTTHLVNRMPVFSSWEIQWFQALIHTGFHHFQKSNFSWIHTLYIHCKWKKLSKLKSGQYPVWMT